MTAFLFGQALLQRLEQFLEPAHGLDLFLLVLGQIFFGELLEPLRGDLSLDAVAKHFQALEHVAEDPVEFVDVALVLHQRGARQIVEILDAPERQVRLQRLHQRQVFAQRHRHAGRFQFGEEIDEHGASTAMQHPCCSAAES